MSACSIVCFQAIDSIVHGLQWHGDNEAAMQEFTGARFDLDGDNRADAAVRSRGRWVDVHVGDWVMQTDEGRLYVRDSEAIAALYRPITVPAHKCDVGHSAGERGRA